MTERICYLDNNATTRVAPEVLEAMLPYWTELWGNPSSAYRFGHQLVAAIDAAREQVAALIHADPREVIFTSCGTESNNAAIQSALVMQPGKRHVLTSAVEHSANMKFGRLLEKRGYEVSYVPVESDGSIDLHLLEKSIRPDTAIASFMMANNETGVLFPVEEIAAICRSRGVLIHTDAVQAAAKVPLNVRELDVDYLSLSAHKFHAPKGIGALYARRAAPFQAYLVGGQQERGRRGGTENVPYIVGMGRAAELAAAHLRAEKTRVRRLRDRLEQEALKSIPRSARNGAADQRLPNTSNLGFEGVEAEAILLLLDRIGICASSGSACTTGSLEPSHVLLAMGLAPERARGCVRFSLGLYNTDEDVDFLLKHLPGIVATLRAESPGGSPAETHAKSRRSHKDGTGQSPASLIAAART